MTLINGVLTIDTKTQTATIENGIITSLRAKDTGKVYIETDAKYIAYGSKLGFHIAPHMNSMEIDPTHKTYPLFCQRYI